MNEAARRRLRCSAGCERLLQTSTAPPDRAAGRHGATPTFAESLSAKPAAWRKTSKCITSCPSTPAGRNCRRRAASSPSAGRATTSSDTPATGRRGGLTFAASPIRCDRRKCGESDRIHRRAACRPRRLLRPWLPELPVPTAARGREPEACGKHCAW